jgi:carbon-monoxide dehydrogenase medium subunit
MEFRSVETEEAAIEQLSKLGDDARILAGGTDLVLQHSRGEVHAGVMLHIGNVQTLRQITVADDTVAIGALTTHLDVQRDCRVAARFPALAEAAATVGGWQTQAAGTLGGNVCNASPAADTIPPLLVADAEVELVAERGMRVMPLEEFVVGRRQISRDPDELLTCLRLPLPPARTGAVYLKVAPRRAMEVALVGLAVRITQGTDGLVTDARIAVCAAGPRPFRARSAERAFLGAAPVGSASAEAGRLLAEEVRPIDDARATARYRRQVIPALLERAIDMCCQRLQAA